MSWQYASALTALTVVGLFWTAAALGWLKVLRDSDSPLHMLIWLYVMLIAVIGSIVVGALALVDLQRRFMVGRNRSADTQPAIVNGPDFFDVGQDVPVLDILYRTSPGQNTQP
jgi:hypothetical protein